MYDGCNFDIAPLRLSNPSLLLMFKELCARRLLSAGENEYSTGYILCQQKIYFFSKIFHFFPFFFPGGKTGESGPEFCWMTGGKHLGKNAPGWTGPPHGLWRPAAQPWSGGGRAASRKRSGRPRVTEQRKGGSRIMLRNDNIEENFDMDGHL